MKRYLSTLVIPQLLHAPVWKEVDYSNQLVLQFLDLTNNPSKCKELTIKKRGNCDLCSPIGMIPSCKEVEILGFTFQCDTLGPVVRRFPASRGLSRRGKNERKDN